MIVYLGHVYHVSFNCTFISLSPPLSASLSSPFYRVMNACFVFKVFVPTILALYFVNKRRAVVVRMGELDI